MNKDVSLKLNELDKAIKKMSSVVFAGIVDWGQLLAIPLNETVSIGNTFNLKLYQDHKCIIFKTIIPPKESFPYHLHDFLESNFLIEGELIDEKKTYKKNDWMTYNALEGHEVVNNTDYNSEIIVIFTK